MAYTLSSGIAVSLNNTPTSATYASGGAPGSTSVVITATNSNIAYDQTITGTGFAANTKVTGINGTTINFSPAASGQVSGTITFATTWYRLTDHNRSEIQISPILIEKEQRMANGTLRKFIVSKKDVIATSWDFLPSTSTTKSPIVDTTSLVPTYGASWMSSFYNANVGNPIYIQLVAAKNTDPSLGQIPNNSTFASSTTGRTVYQVFISDFSRTIRKRTSGTDFVDINIEFTEI